MFPNPKLKPDIHALQAELELLFDNCNEVNSMKEISKICFDLKVVIPLAYRVCQFLLTAGYVTASNERTFSSLKFIKNLLRSRMNDDRLEYLIILFSENDFTDALNFDSCVQKWQLLKNRRINL